MSDEHRRYAGPPPRGGRSRGGRPAPHPAPAREQETNGAAGERLQKYLAHAGVASRRHAEELILAGLVTVNGQVVTELGTRVDPEHDEVRVNGEPAQPVRQHLYILLNKPTDVVTTSSDRHAPRTVLDLLPDDWRERRVYPVGRLDRDTEGLLLLTDDGELALRLTHPRYALTKEYAALVAGRPSTGALDRLAHGLLLPGETRPTAPARAWLEQTAGDATWVGMEIHEGRNRQVRRMLAAAGHPVLRLRRVRVGPLTLGTLAPGRTRLLTSAEVDKLRRAVGLATG